MHDDWPYPTPYFGFVVGPNEILIIPDIPRFVSERVIAPLEATLKLIDGRVPSRVWAKAAEAMRAATMLGRPRGGGGCSNKPSADNEINS